MPGDTVVAPDNRLTGTLTATMPEGNPVVETYPELHHQLMQQGVLGALIALHTIDHTNLLDAQQQAKLVWPVKRKDILQEPETVQTKL